MRNKMKRKISIDTEFHEYKRDGIDTIELISLALVDDKGNERYYVNKEFNVGAAWNNEWLRENVLRNLVALTPEPTFAQNFIGEFSDFTILIDAIGETKKNIRESVLRFVGEEDVEFYGYYADYDWVVFCWLFGRMIDLPKNFPMYCNDLKQTAMSLGLGKDWIEETVPNPENEHNALADARWNVKLLEAIAEEVLQGARP